jgi:SAM-dependent methyltransferase
MKLVKINCPLCDSNSSEILFDGKDREHPIPGTFPVVQCRDCDLVYLNPRPSEDSLQECYPDDYDSYVFGVGSVGKLQKYLRRQTAKKIGSILPRGSRILEVGCATGDLLAPLRDVAGLQVVGVELSPHAANIAINDHGLDVHIGKLSDFNFELASFDGVVMRNVLEHLPDPLGDLKKAASLLKKGGHVFIDVPNFDSLDRMLFGKYWYGYSTPRHLTVPSVKTLKRMLSVAGFEVTTVHHSMLPNNWIGSLKNVFEGVSGRLNSFKIINFRNPLFILLTLPFGAFQKILRKSGRVHVVAVKKQEVR